MPNPMEDFELAAGGILLKPTARGVQVAIVHRQRYDDWALPKGHVEREESWQEAAIREVKEETGCAAEIEHMVSPVSYLAKGVPKMVVFFVMRLITESPEIDREEVDEIRWLRPRTALRKLSYSSERRLVRQLLKDGSP